MTEEIIIDGVNVAGCIRFNKDTGYCKGAFKPEEEPYCQCFTCEYKQLKRLEQENKELKSRVDEQWKLLEQCGINSGGELRRAGYIINDFVQLSNKYRSALEEIKNYCEKCKKCVETGDEVILYTVIKKANEVLNG